MARDPYTAELNDGEASPGEMPELSRFEILRPIGEGGSGVVYEARDRERGVHVALKMLRLPDAEQLLRLKEEFRSLADVEHTNLIRLFELIHDAGTWFFTMELIVGTTFPEYVGGASAVPNEHAESQMRSRTASRAVPRTPASEASPLDEAKLRDGLIQLTRGLAALHAAGKVHRDIKPSNILVSTEGRVVILDFGLAIDATAPLPLEADAVVGTIPYAAPEQLDGAEVGPAADWYSVGAVLYQCLTGVLPFTGSLIEVIERKRTEDPIRPCERVPGVPPDLDALCIDLLSRDPSLRPSSRNILRRLASTDTGEHASKALGPRAFVGRKIERQALLEAFEEAVSEAGLSVILQGESGVGKSALVRQFTRQVEANEGTLVLRGRCYEREDVPFKAIDGVIDALSDHLSTFSKADVLRILPRAPDAFVLTHAFPVLLRSPAVASLSAPPGSRRDDGRTQLFEALRTLFSNLASLFHLVVVIDDLQWADADSLVALASIQRAPAPPFLLLATARPGTPKESRVIPTNRARRDPRGASPTDADARPLGLHGTVRVIPVERLSAEEGRELIGKIAEDLPAVVRDRIVEEANGHPLFVDELVRHAQFLGGDAALLQHAGLLDDALLARVARLDEASRDLLTILSVAGVALAQETAMRAAAAPFDAFAGSIHTLRVTHLAKTHGRRGKDSIEPYHDRVREAVAASLDERSRQAVHRRIAVALEAEPTRDADALSTHWLGAGESAKAGEYAKQAAEKARGAMAFDAAARHFERVLSHANLDPDARRDVLIKFAETLAQAGRCVDASHAFSEAAALSPADLALDLRRRAAEELLIAGRIDEGDVALRKVLAAVGVYMPRTPLVALIGLLLCRLALLVRGRRFKERSEAEIDLGRLTRLDTCINVGKILSLVDTIRGAYFQANGFLQALAVGEPSRVMNALCAEAVYCATSGHDVYAKTLLDEARAISERLPDARHDSVLLTASTMASFVLGRFDEAKGPSAAAEAMLRERAPGAVWERRMAQFASVIVLGWRGELAELSVRVEAGVREAECQGDTYSATALQTGVPNLTWLRTGDSAKARTIVIEALRQWSQRGYHGQHYWALLALARIELYEGDGRAALARVRRHWPRLVRALTLEVRVMRVEALHLRSSAALAVASEVDGRSRERLLRIAEKDARALQKMTWSLADPFAHLLRAQIAKVRGDTASAATELRLSMDQFLDISMFLHGNAVRFCLGRMLPRAEGRALVVEAERWMAEQGVADPLKMSATFAPAFCARGSRPSPRFDAEILRPTGS